MKHITYHKSLCIGRTPILGAENFFFANSVDSKPGPCSKTQGKDFAFNCEVQLKAQICACELVTNNRDTVKKEIQTYR